MREDGGHLLVIEEARANVVLLQHRHVRLVHEHRRLERQREHALQDRDFAVTDAGAAPAFSRCAW